MKSTAMSVPAAGQNLTFSPNYASGRASLHSSGYPTGTMGNGWVHNYDMRLVTDDSQTELDNSVELQTPEGNYLPFLDQGNGTYEAYAGVMASLVENGDGSYTVTGEDQMTYEFDSSGKLTSQTDSNGNTVTFTYHTSGNGTGQLYRATQGGRYLQYDYNAQGQLITVTDHTSRTTTLTYDGNGNLNTVTNPISETTTYSYTDASYPYHLTKVTDDTGREVKEIKYDASGRAYETLDGDDNVLVSIDYTNPEQPIINNRGVTETHSYDGRGTLTGVTYNCTGDPGCGESISSGYDGQFKATDLVDSAGNPTSMTWSENGFNLESVTNALTQTTSMQYDSYNNVTHITDAQGHTITNTYTHPNLPRFLTSTTNELGQVTVYTPTYNTVQNSVSVPDGLLLAQKGPNGVVTQYEYDEYGQMIKQTVGYGTSSAIVTSYSYDALGRLQTVTDGNNVKLLNVYDGADRTIATIENWTGSNPANWQTDCVTTGGERDSNICTEYAYDGAGRLISTTDPLGRINLNFYDDASRMYLTVQNYDGTGYTDPETDLCDFVTPDDEYNLCSKTEYDSHGRVIATTDPLGRVTRTEYDSLGRVAGTIVNSVSVTTLSSCSFDPDRTNSDEDLCTVYTYDERSNVIITKDPAGRQTRTFYDELNRSILTVQNWTGTINGEADFGLCTTSNGTDNDENICSFTEYDEVGNVIVTTDAAGVKTRTFYDDLNRVIATVQNWNDSVDASQVGDPVNNPSDCLYDADNLNEENICSKVGYDPVTGQQTTSTNALDQTTLTVYDELGRAFLTVANWDGVTVIDEASDCTFNPTPANSDTNLCSVTEFDTLGRRSKTIDPKGFETVYGYDDLGRVITTTRYLDGGATPVVSTSDYDALGNLLSSTNAENQTMSYQYDTLNRTTQTTSAEGVISTQTYNALGWVLTSSNNYNYTTVNTYDDLGRLKTTTDPESNTTTFVYDVLGNQVAKIDANNIKTTYGYDGLNRLDSVIENDTGTTPTVDANVLTQYHYDVRGNQLHTIDARNIQQRTTEYDSLNRRISVTDALSNTTSYSYDALGNLRSMTDGNSETTQYAYDGLNRQTVITYTADVETVTYSYDALGNVDTMTDGTGTTSYDYDDLSRPITITYPITGVVGYGYDKLGNRTSITYPDNKVVTYSYDDDSRLDTVTDWDSQVTNYDYDAIGRLITTTLPNGVTTVNTYDTSDRLTDVAHTTITGTVASFNYTLDGVGNRLAVTETLMITDTLSSSGTCGSLVQQAENGEITGGFVVANDSAASAGQYIHLPPGSGDNTSFDENEMVTYCFNVTTAGYYQLKGWVYTPDSSSDSFFVKIDNAPAGGYVWESVPQGGGFGTDYLSDTGTDPVVVQLGVGEHIVAVSPKDDGARLDKLHLELMTTSQTGTPTVTGLILVDAATDTPRPDYDPLEDGAVINLQQVFNDDFNIKAQVSGAVGSVVFSGSFSRTESTAPYTLFGDSNGDYVSQVFSAGTYTVTATPYSGSGGSGTAYTPYTVSFTVIESSSGTPTVTDFTLVNADTDQPFEAFDPLLDGATINLAELPTNNFNVTANVTGSVGSVVFSGVNNRTESAAPYTLYGDNGGDYWGQTFSTGTYTVTATPYTASGGGGTAGTPVTVSFTVIDDSSSATPTGTTTTQTTVIDYEYDDLYRLTEADYTGALTMTYQYEYDAVGNMKTVTETNSITTTVETRSHNNADQLTTSFHSVDGTTSFYYDDNGNLDRIMWPGTGSMEELYEYDQRNLLITYSTFISSTTSTMAEFVYDGNGDRVQLVQYVNGQPITTTNVIDTAGHTQVLVASNGTNISTNLFGADLISVEDVGQDTYVLGDALGSGRVELLENDWLSTTTYEPFGNLVARTGAKGTVYGFTGEQEDSGTGLVYLRARYYNPRWRIFMSRDLFPGWRGIPASQHPYSYVHNNPILHVDPSGEAVNLVALLAGAVGGAIIGGSIDIIMQLILTGEIDWRLVSASAAGGAAQGAVCGVSLGLACAVGGGALNGAISKIVQDLLDVDNDCDTTIDWLGVAGDAAIGGAFGLLAHGISQSVIGVKNRFNIGRAFDYVDDHIDLSKTTKGGFGPYNKLDTSSAYQKHHPIGGKHAKDLPNYSKEWYRKALTQLLYGGEDSTSAAKKGSAHYLFNRVQAQTDDFTKHLQAYRSLGLYGQEKVAISQLWELGYSKKRIIKYLFTRSIKDPRIVIPGGGTSIDYGDLVTRSSPTRVRP